MVKLNKSAKLTQKPLNKRLNQQMRKKLATRLVRRRERNTKRRAKSESMTRRRLTNTTKVNMKKWMKKTNTLLTKNKLHLHKLANKAKSSDRSSEK